MDVRLPKLLLRRGRVGGRSSPSTPYVESSLILDRVEMVLKSEAIVVMGMVRRIDHFLNSLTIAGEKMRESLNHSLA